MVAGLISGNVNTTYSIIAYDMYFHTNNVCVKFTPKRVIMIISRYLIQYKSVVLLDKALAVHVPEPVSTMSSLSIRVTSAKSLIAVFYLGEQRIGGRCCEGSSLYPQKTRRGNIRSVHSTMVTANSGEQISSLSS